jgi:hypothetical protein
MKHKSIGFGLTIFATIGLVFYVFLKISPLPQKEKKTESPQVAQNGLQNPSLQSSATFKRPPATDISLIKPEDSGSFEVDTTRSAHAATDIVVPPGARVPAVLMDAGAPDDSEETRNIMTGIIEEFAAKIQEAKQANRNMEEAWEQARAAADDSYRQFFGFEAYNAASLEAAGEAYEESTSLPAASKR